MTVMPLKNTVRRFLSSPDNPTWSYSVNRLSYEFVPINLLISNVWCQQDITLCTKATRCGYAYHLAWAGCKLAGSDCEKHRLNIYR